MPVLPNALDEVLAVAVALSRPLLEHVHCLIVTLGAHGILVCGEHDGSSINLQPRKQKRVKMSYYLPVIPVGACDTVVLFLFQKRKLCALHYPALTVLPEETANVSGAGDRC